MSTQKTREQGIKAGRAMAATILDIDPNGTWRIEDIASAYEDLRETEYEQGMAVGLRAAIPARPPRRVVTARLDSAAVALAQKHLASTGRTLTSVFERALDDYLTQHGLTTSPQEQNR